MAAANDSGKTADVGNTGTAAAAAAVPEWNSEFAKLLGNDFVNNSGTKFTAADLRGKTIGIYFSAQWCPPCRMFTPELVKTYNQLKAANKAFEIIFASSDSDDKSFSEYFKKMPWLAMPFAERKRKELLSNHYKVQGIPTLVMLDPTGAVITRNGRMAVSMDPSGQSFPWTPKAADELTGNTAQELNEKAALFIFASNAGPWNCGACSYKNDGSNRCTMCGALKPAGAGAPSAADAKLTSDAVAAFTKVATAVQSEAKAAGKESAIDFLYGLEHPVVSKVKQFLEIPTGTVMTILDIPNGCKYIWSEGKQISDLNEKAIRDFYDAYSAGRLTKVMLPMQPHGDDDDY